LCAIATVSTRCSTRRCTDGDAILHSATHKDILTLLLSARDEDDERLTDRELRDELITLLLAGHETTATSIGWAFERLLRTPSALERLTAEAKPGHGGN
jgi:cytochrome P450